MGGAVAESYIYITAFAHDEFGNPCAPPAPVPARAPEPPPGRRALDSAIYNCTIILPYKKERNH